MIVLLSPAKTIDCSEAVHASSASQPVFMEDASFLVRKLAKFSPKRLEVLMKISPDLAQLNFDRYQAWNAPFHPGNSKPCISCFQGEVYRGLDAKSWNDPDLEHAQSHLRILSGLYGVLRPLDLMQPYRLEMGTRWEIGPKQKNLYSFWGNRVGESIEADAEGHIVNLASQEYSKVIQRAKLPTPIIDIDFKDLVKGELKTLGTYAKHARGRMARYAVKQKITHPEELKGFEDGGYAFDERLSNETNWVFTRDHNSNNRDV